MGPWMMGRLAKQYGVASPKELLEVAQEMGVEFIPCQMTMDMFGLKPEDMIEGMGEPVGAATVIGLHDRQLRPAVHLGRTMTAMTDTAVAITRTVDARGSFCPGPLMELIRAIRESQVGDVIAVYSSDKGSKTDIPKWVEKAGHRLVALETRDGYDEIVVEKLR